MDNAVIIGIINSSWVLIPVSLLLAGYFVYQFVNNFVRVGKMKAERVKLEFELKDLEVEYEKHIAELKAKMKEREELFKKRA
jgi:hypothetical protein